MSLEISDETHCAIYQQATESVTRSSHSSIGLETFLFSVLHSYGRISCRVFPKDIVEKAVKEYSATISEDEPFVFQMLASKSGTTFIVLRTKGLDGRYTTDPHGLQPLFVNVDVRGCTYPNQTLQLHLENMRSDCGQDGGQPGPVRL